MAELFVFNLREEEPGKPCPPVTGLFLTGELEGGGVFEQVGVESSTLPWPEERDRTAEAQRESDQEEEEEQEEEDDEWAEGPESWTESTRQLGGDRSSGEIAVQKWEDERREGGVRDRGDGSLADDEEEEEDEGQVSWMPEKASYAFNPLVTIKVPPMEQEECGGERAQNKGTAAKHPKPPTVTQPHRNRPQCRQPQPHQKQTQQPQTHQSQIQLPQWIQALQHPSRGCCHCCSEAVRLVASLFAAAVIFPFLVWAGYDLLPFDSPSLSTAALRVVYTLRCAFFATFPIVLGVLMQGVSRLKFGMLRPLFSARQMGREVFLHGNFVRDSLQLYLLYFVQLAVTATYINQDMLKLVPLLTIIFVFGRLIYWACVSLGSSVRALGFGLSFFPLLALLGLNLYFVCSSTGLEAVFDTAPPPPPLQNHRWWG
ncbi:transmembrane protein 79 [Brachyhypopomus gauderio]|uniref:transmembrane protein 79 n=1 Tax=Brachyhypopomus gauderio TaxID=698409 RepID=UPI0040424A14